MKLEYSGIKYLTPVFEKLTPFEIFSIYELEKLYFDNIKYSVNELEYFKVMNGDITGNEFVKTVQKRRVLFDSFALQRKLENKDIINATGDITSKTMMLSDYLYGKVFFFKIPNSIIKNYQKATLHNSDTSLISQFIKEVEETNPTWEYEDYQKLLEDYDKKYPETTKVRNKDHEVFKWRADFAPSWYRSIKVDGLLNPIAYYSMNEYILNRGTHRSFLLGEAGYDIPVFGYIPYSFMFKHKEFEPTLTTLSFQLRSDKHETTALFGGDTLTLNVNIANKRIDYYLENQGLFLGYTKDE